MNPTFRCRFSIIAFFGAWKERPMQSGATSSDVVSTLYDWRYRFDKIAGGRPRLSPWRNPDGPIGRKQDCYPDTHAPIRMPTWCGGWAPMLYRGSPLPVSLGFLTALFHQLFSDGRPRSAHLWESLGINGRPLKSIPLVLPDEGGLDAFQEISISLPHVS